MKGGEPDRQAGLNKAMPSPAKASVPAVHGMNRLLLWLGAAAAAWIGAFGAVVMLFGLVFAVLYLFGMERIGYIAALTMAAGAAVTVVGGLIARFFPVSRSARFALSAAAVLSFSPILSWVYKPVFALFG